MLVPPFVSLLLACLEERTSGSLLVQLPARGGRLSPSAYVGFEAGFPVSAAGRNLPATLEALLAPLCSQLAANFSFRPLPADLTFSLRGRVDPYALVAETFRDSGRAAFVHRHISLADPTELTLRKGINLARYRFNAEERKIANRLSTPQSVLSLTADKILAVRVVRRVVYVLRITGACDERSQPDQAAGHPNTLPSPARTPASGVVEPVTRGWTRPRVRMPRVTTLPYGEAAGRELVARSKGPDAPGAPSQPVRRQPMSAPPTSAPPISASPSERPSGRYSQPGSEERLGTGGAASASAAAPVRQRPSTVPPPPTNLSQAHKGRWQELRNRYERLTHEDYYRALGIPRTADAQLIARAFKNEVERYNPVHLPVELRSISRYALIVVDYLKQAHATLKDPQLRAGYDAQLRARDI